MHVPCVTIRENTERPVTVSMGSNILAGIRQDSIVEAYRSARQRGKSGTVPPYWDGKAAERIWDVLLKVH